MQQGIPQKLLQRSKQMKNNLLPKVSILIPTYNGEKFIKATIDSCLSQTYPNLEIIVTDDCSTDGTIEILKKYGDKINLFINNANLGIVKNINNGVKLSTGSYFILLGHDDILPCQHVEQIITEFDDNTVAVHCNSIIIDSTGNKQKLSKNDSKQIKKTKNSLYRLSIKNFISSCGMIHKREIFDKVGGWDEKYKNYGEWLYYVNMLKFGTLKYTVKTKAFYRKHDTNITNTFNNIDVYSELEAYKQRCKDLAYDYHTYTLSEYFIYLIIKIKYLLKTYRGNA